MNSTGEFEYEELPCSYNDQAINGSCIGHHWYQFFAQVVGVIIATYGGYLGQVGARELAEAGQISSFGRSLGYTCFFIFVSVPAYYGVFVSSLWGGILALCEDWMWQTGIMYVVQTTIGLGNPLTNASPTTPASDVVCTFVAAISLAFGGLVIMMFNNNTFIEALVRSIEKLFTRWGKYASFLGLSFYAIICVPIAVTIISFIMGGIMAAVEGWKFSLGFLYVSSNLCSLANPLTIVSPVTNVGIYLSQLISIWALTMGAALVGAISNFEIVDIFFCKLAEGEVACLAWPHDDDRSFRRYSRTRSLGEKSTSDIRGSQIIRKSEASGNPKNGGGGSAPNTAAVCDEAAANPTVCPETGGDMNIV